MTGRYVNLFDSELRVLKEVKLAPGSRFLLFDLGSAKSKQPRVLAAAGKLLVQKRTKRELKILVEGVGNTQGIILVGNVPKPPRSVFIAKKQLESLEYSEEEKLLWVRFRHQPTPRQLVIQF